MLNLQNKKNIDCLLLYFGLIFLIIINFAYFYLHITLKIDSNDYAFNELFINYQAGFIRRGLIGEILYNIHNISGIRLDYILFVFVFVTYAFFFFIIYRLITSIKLNFINTLIIFYV